MLKNSIVKTDLLPRAIEEMLGNIDIKIDYTENLSESQKKAFKLFQEKKNLVIFSSAGCGKSFCIKTMQESVKNTDRKMQLCSTTGISAYNIGGMTINSFMGIGTGDQDVNFLIRKVSRTAVYRDRIIEIDVLVIDEISMLSASLMEKLNTLCQVVRKSKKFFGGIQVIFTGDPLQLEAIFNSNKKIYKDIDERLIVESDIFNKEFNQKKGNVLILKENFRQKGDPTFINMLLRIRNNTYTKEDLEILNKRKIMPKEDFHVHLVSTNKKAQDINDNNLKKINESDFIFKACYTSTGKNKELRDILTKELEFQFKQKGIDNLILRKNARVMLVKNLDVELGLVNGALGTIIEIKDKIITVKFDNEIEYNILPVNWDIQIDNCKATSTQIPLMLAYAITIFKSQSLTLNSAILDLDDCFANHMVYVALSRLKSLDGMYLKSFNSHKIKINEKIKEYLENLK
jgi:ATP-dependent DNA helicase PIF1